MSSSAVRCAAIGEPPCGHRTPRGGRCRVRRERRRSGFGGSIEPGRRGSSNAFNDHEQGRAPPNSTLGITPGGGEKLRSHLSRKLSPRGVRKSGALPMRSLTTLIASRRSSLMATPCPRICSGELGNEWWRSTGDNWVTTLSAPTLRPSSFTQLSTLTLSCAHTSTGSAGLNKSIRRWSGMPPSALPH